MIKFQYKDCRSRHRNSHDKDEIITALSYLYCGNLYASEITSLYKVLKWPQRLGSSSSKISLHQILLCFKARRFKYWGYKLLQNLEKFLQFCPAICKALHVHVSVFIWLQNFHTVWVLTIRPLISSEAPLLTWINFNPSMHLQVITSIIKHKIKLLIHS